MVNYLVLVFIIILEGPLLAKPYMAIDVGATNVKIGIIDSKMSVDSLKKTSDLYEKAMGSKIYKIPTTKVLDADIPIVDFINPSFVQDTLRFFGYQKATEVEKIGVSLPLYLKNSRITYKRGGNWSKIPTYLSGDIERAIGEHKYERAVLANDAVAWALGTIKAIQTMKNEKLKYPAIGIAFGTGLAISLMRAKNHITILNVNDLPNKYFQTDFWRSQGVKNNSDIHNLVATPFFRSHQFFKDGFDGQSKETFSKRFINLIKDLHTLARFELSEPVKHFYVLGGLANILEQQDFMQELSIVNSNGAANITIVGKEKVGINTDLIPMIGMIDYAHRRGRVRVDLASAPNVTNIAIRASNNKYLSALNGGGGAVRAFIDKHKVKSWEIFRLEHHPKRNWALATENNSYLSAVHQGGGDLMAYGKEPLSWEEWEIQNFGYGKIAFLAPNKTHYLSAAEKFISVNQTSLSETEIFRIEYR